MSISEWNDRRAEEVAERDITDEPPFCDNCGSEEHHMDDCDVKFEDDDQYTGPTFREDDSG